MQVQAKAKEKQFVRKFVKNLDSYGYPINMTYKSSSEFKTVFGGAITIFFRMIVLLYIGFQINDLAHNKNTIKTKTVHKNLAIDQEKWNLTQTNFDIAWRLSSRELSESEP